MCQETLCTIHGCDAEAVFSFSDTPYRGPFCGPHAWAKWQIIKEDRKTLRLDERDKHRREQREAATWRERQRKQLAVVGGRRERVLVPS